jgi:hypothetical protein
VLHATGGGATGQTTRKMKLNFLLYKLCNLKETETMKYMEIIRQLQRTPHKSEVIHTFNFISTLGLQSCACSVNSNHRKRWNILRAHGIYQLLLFGFPNESSSYEGLKPVFVQRNIKFSEWKYNGTYLKRNRSITETCLC